MPLCRFNIPKRRRFNFNTSFDFGSLVKCSASSPWGFKISLNTSCVPPQETTLATAVFLFCLEEYLKIFLLTNLVMWSDFWGCLWNTRRESLRLQTWKFNRHSRNTERKAKWNKASDNQSWSLFRTTSDGCGPASITHVNAALSVKVMCHWRDKVPWRAHHESLS